MSDGTHSQDSQAGDPPNNALVPTNPPGALNPSPAAGSPTALLPMPLEPPPTGVQRGIGVMLISVGMLGFVAVAILALCNRPPTGQVPAIALVLLILGLVFFFPSLLRESASTDAGVSTMRVLVVVIITVFALLTVCNGWNNATFKLDQYWVWIVFVAIGGKAGQRAVELFAQSSSK